MNKITIFLFSSLLLIGCARKESACVDPIIETPVETEGFDSFRASLNGADDYGMRKYVMAFLKSGPNRDLSPEESKELQEKHMANIGRMANNRQLVLAGPFLDESEYRGIYIFDVETIEEAKKLTESDPAIQAGSLVMELHPWYGSAAIQEINDIHEKISKIKF